MATQTTHELLTQALDLIKEAKGLLDRREILEERFAPYSPTHKAIMLDLDDLDRADKAINKAINRRPIYPVPPVC